MNTPWTGTCSSILPHRQTQDFFKAMNAFYLQQPALWQQDDSWHGFQWLCADDNTANTVSFLRWDKDGKPLLVVCNFSPNHRNGYRVGAPFAGVWTPVLNTDDTQFGGQGLGDHDPVKTEKVPCHDQAQSLVIDLPPMSAMIYRCSRRFPVRKPAAPKADQAAAKKAAPKKRAAKAKTAAAPPRRRPPRPPCRRSLPGRPSPKRSPSRPCQEGGETGPPGKGEAARSAPKAGADRPAQERGQGRPLRSAPAQSPDGPQVHPQKGI